MAVYLHQVVELLPVSYTHLDVYKRQAYGSDTYWDVIGRQFGLTNINHFRPADN